MQRTHLQSQSRNLRCKGQDHLFFQWHQCLLTFAKTFPAVLIVKPLLDFFKLLVPPPSKPVKRVLRHFVFISNHTSCRISSGRRLTTPLYPSVPAAPFLTLSDSSKFMYDQWYFKMWTKLSGLPPPWACTRECPRVADKVESGVGRQDHPFYIFILLRRS